MRWGHGIAVHPELARTIAASRDVYAEHIRTFLQFRGDLERIPVRDETPPAWVNYYLGAIDCLALYGFVRTTRPARYMEIGSGVSTHLAARAIADAGASTQIVSIDPSPRSDVDALASTRIAQPLEDADLGVFDALQPGDIVFYDGSHRVFMNSDVTVFFLEVLPRLPPGVLVHVHDVFWPEDYLPDWADRHYSEQYLLGAWLLGGGAGLEILFPSWYIHTDPELTQVARPLWDALRLAPDEYRGCSFWMRKTR